MEDVLHHYTIDQVKLFFKAGMKNKMQEQIDMAILTRLGFHASKKQWNEFMDKTKDGKERQQQPVKIIGKREYKEVENLLAGRWRLKKK